MKSLKQFLNELNINLDEFQSPCLQCWRRGIEYSKTNKICAKCGYNISIQLLKIMLKGDSGCRCCKNSIWDGYADVCNKNDAPKSCWKCNDMVIDWEKAYDENKNWY